MDRLPEGLLLVPSGAPDQMHYGWWRRLDSNQRHRAYESDQPLLYRNLTK